MLFSVTQVSADPSNIAQGQAGCAEGDGGPERPGLQALRRAARALGPRGLLPVRGCQCRLSSGVIPHEAESDVD